MSSIYPLEWLKLRKTITCWWECRIIELSYSAGRNVNWCTHFGILPVMLNMDPVILLLGMCICMCGYIYMTCTRIFTIARTVHQQYWLLWKFPQWKSSIHYSHSGRVLYINESELTTAILSIMNDLTNSLRRQVQRNMYYMILLIKSSYLW